MEAYKKQILGYLRFFKKDGSEGAAFPLRADEEYTIGFNHQTTIRLKEYKNTLKPVQCAIKVDTNGFAKLITKDSAHPLKLNNKALYGSKYLLPNDTFSVFDKKFKYENPDISKNNLMKLSSMNTQMKSPAVTGRKYYTDMKRRRYTDIVDMTKHDDSFQSLKGSKTPHLRRQLMYLKPAVSLKTPSPLPAAAANAMQTPESIQHRELNTSTENEFANDDLTTPPNNKSMVEINSMPFPSARKRRSMTSGADDDLESADTKTPKTHSKFRNSLHLFSSKKGRKSSLCNSLISIPESENDALGSDESAVPKKSFTRSSVLTRRSSKINLINEGEVSEPKLTNDDLPEQPSTRKSAAKLNETFSGGDDTNSDEDFTEKQKSYFDDSLAVAAVQKQTPSTRKSAANLNETFSEDDFSVPERKAVARKLNKTSSDADVFSVEKKGRERRFSDFIISSRKTVTPVLKIKKSSALENLNSPSASPAPVFIHRRTSMASTAKKSLRRSTLTSENVITVSTPSPPANNITLRRPLRNVTSAYRLLPQDAHRSSQDAYRLSQENIILCNSDLDHSQKSADESTDDGSQENRIAMKTLSNSMSKSVQSESFSKVFHSPKKSRSYSKSFVSSSSHSESKSLIKFSPSTEEDFEQVNAEQHGINNNHETESIVNYSVNEGEISEESSLVKQLTLVLSDEEHGDQESSIKSNDASSLLETTDSSSFYYERASTTNVNSTFPDLSNVSSSLRHTELESSTPASNAQRILRSSKTPSDLRGVQNILSATAEKTNKSDVVGLVKTPQEQLKNDLSDVREELLVTHKIENSSQVARLERLMKTPKLNKSPVNDLRNVAGVRKLMETPRDRKQPKNDLSDVAGVRKLMKTPREQKQPKNDLSNVAGLRKLMETPRERKQPKNDLSDVAGVRKLMGTPREQKQPKNDLSDVAGVRQLMETPRYQRQPKNDLSDVAGVRKLLETPRGQKQPKNDLSDVRGIRKLMSTPKQQISPLNDITDVKGVKRLMRTPKANKSPKNDLTDVRGLKRLMRTPKAIKSPLNDLTDVRGVRDLMRSSKRKESMDLSGVKELLTTPVVSATASTSDAESDQVLMSDFDALLNRKPIRTYKSKSPLKSKLNSLITDDNAPVQPDVAKWVEEQDDYLQSQIKQVDSNLRVTPARALRSKTKIEEKSEEVDPVILTRSRRLPKNKQRVEEGISPKREERMLTRSRRLPAGASHLEEKDSKNKERVEEIRNRQRGRLPKTLNSPIADDNIPVQPDVAKWVEEQDDYLQSEIKQVDSNLRVTPARALRSKIKIEEKSEEVDPVIPTRSRRLPKNKQQVEEGISPKREERMLTRSRRLPAGASHLEEKDSKNTETVEDIRNMQRGRLPKNKQHVEDSPKADGEDAQAGLEGHDDDNKRQGTRPNTRSKKPTSTDAKEKAKTTRSRKQVSKNELPETETSEQAEAISLRTRKRKAVAALEVTADEVSLKKTKKAVTFEVVDSPRRSNRTPRKTHRIADEEFEFNINSISVGHSKKSTRRKRK